ncbi:hypothetical protein L6R53_21690 [Myxococcota bacterium]|nr:hypothetical protein [Myxococcota bacterium]
MDREEGTLHAAEVAVDEAVGVAACTMTSPAGQPLVDEYRSVRTVGPRASTIRDQVIANM